jgi:hypothetical protein
MFGNDFIDYCAIHYNDLTKLSTGGFDELVMNHLSDHSKVFISFYQQLQSSRGVEIPVSVFLSMGIDFTRLCLLVFLVFTREGNTVIKFSPDMQSFTYQP